MKFLAWNTDTQNDFMNKDGKLSVQGAEEIKPTLHQLTSLFNNRHITKVNTMDWHQENSKELSINPDFVTKFPIHCMQNTIGAEFVKETHPNDHNAIVVDWNKPVCYGMPIHESYCTKNSAQYEWGIKEFEENILKAKNIIIRKDAFDVFEGNKNTDKIVSTLKAETVFVYGVATNVCVNRAVLGLSKKVKNVYVVLDAIKELPNIPINALINEWVKQGVKFTYLNNTQKVNTNIMNTLQLLELLGENATCGILPITEILNK